ncbi:hypothetical protein V8C34DRAFT_272110 [Trichoderma compactum]
MNTRGEDKVTLSFSVWFCEIADGEKCGVDPRICTNPRLARVACSPVGWPATGSANRLRPMQDLEW